MITILVIGLAACQQPGGNSPGSEYMPDMAHSVAYEANYYAYYSYNTWGTEIDYFKLAQPRLPVEGTVARTSSKTIAMDGISKVPYHYGDNDEERIRATNELINNPYKITDAGLARAKELYNINCGICHGEKGDGNGYLVRDGSPYPVQPAIFTSDEFVSASNGRFYHSIIYGKNLMGSYADKLSYEERWQVIHYIRSLQAKDRQLVYNQIENTLNNIDEPAGELQVAAVAPSHDHHEDGHHGDGDHGAGHHDHEGEEHHDHDHDHQDGDHGHGDHGHDHDDHEEHNHNH